MRYEFDHLALISKPHLVGDSRLMDSAILYDLDNSNDKAQFSRSYDGCQSSSRDRKQWVKPLDKLLVLFSSFFMLHACACRTTIGMNLNSGLCPQNPLHELLL